MPLTSVLTRADQDLFLLINQLPHPPFLDALFLFFSFYPLIIWSVIGITVVLIEERKEKLFIVRLILALLVAGTLASGFIKPLIRRPRPDIAIGEQVVVVSEKPATFPWNNDFAFPSGHAAVAFAGAFVVLKEETAAARSKKRRIRKQQIKRWVFLGFAALTAFSRIYLGKHYPLDVLAGGFLGWYVGWAAWKIVDLFRPRLAH